MGLGDSIRRMLSPKAARPKAAAATSKTVLAASRRAEMIAWAVEIHRRKSDMGRGALDEALKGFRAKPPKPGDADAMARLLRINGAETSLRRLMNHREWRYLVLAGIRQLLVDAPRDGEPDPKPARRIAVRH